MWHAACMKPQKEGEYLALVRTQKRFPLYYKIVKYGILEYAGKKKTGFYITDETGFAYDLSIQVEWWMELPAIPKEER